MYTRTSVFGVLVAALYEVCLIDLFRRVQRYLPLFTAFESMVKMVKITWHADLVSDLMTVVRRLQTVISFQIADVLQKMLNQWLSSLYLFFAILLFCCVVEFVVRYGKLKSLSILQRVGVIQVGQSLLQLISEVQDINVKYQTLANCVGWLLRTATLCVPAMLYSDVRTNEYVDNAIRVYLYQYTDATREFVLNINFGLPPLYLAVLGVLLSMRAKSWKGQQSRLYEYFYKAFHMLTVDLVLSSIETSTSGSSDYLKILLQAVVVLSIDAINQVQEDMLTEIRSYAIWRIAKQLFDLNVSALDLTSTVGISLMIFVARRVLESRLTSVMSQYLHTIVEILFLTSINLILQPVVSSHATTQLDHMLLVLVIATTAHTIEMLVMTSEKTQK